MAIVWSSSFSSVSTSPTKIGLETDSETVLTGFETCALTSGGPDGVISVTSSRTSSRSSSSLSLSRSMAWSADCPLSSIDKLHTPIASKRKPAQEFMMAYTPDHPHSMPNLASQSRSQNKFVPKFGNTDQKTCYNLFKELQDVPETNGDLAVSGSPIPIGQLTPFLVSNQPPRQMSTTSPSKQRPQDHSPLSPPIQPIFILPNEHERDIMSYSEMQRFPSEFNPRQAANMPHKEKVDKWIVNVPAYPNQSKETWYNECYPPVVELSTASTPEESEVEFASRQDIIEFQSRLITFLVNKSYYNDPTEEINRGEEFEEAHLGGEYSYDTNDGDLNYHEGIY
ncbi:hypothetical protein OGAPHI_005454 [Ogataea philodendri]|uniref:Uncharacterized protein n=1 Tax=Ogataea philodendri TaxID=1378263 RepID=A0A9P8T162_9ASCO|nr:uncharacterized protein OGAPHI_005454 [Ogataea philodendri]KAH3662206.1 hypothetical protein OGAPHI_005454 [Ogataea philodendri]